MKNENRTGKINLETVTVPGSPQHSRPGGQVCRRREPRGARRGGREPVGDLGRVPSDRTLPTTIVDHDGLVTLSDFSDLNAVDEERRLDPDDAGLVLLDLVLRQWPRRCQIPGRRAGSGAGKQFSF